MFDADGVREIQRNKDSIETVSERFGGMTALEAYKNSRISSDAYSYLMSVSSKTGIPI